MPPRAKLNGKPKGAPRRSKASSGDAKAKSTTSTTTSTPSFSLKGVVLKTLLGLIGSPTSGTKSTLISRFRQDVAAPKLSRGAGAGPPRQRVLSVDMGIRNLAFCVADVEIDGDLAEQDKKSEGKHTAASSGPRVSLSVVAWERIAVQELTAAEEDAGKEVAEGKRGEEMPATEEKESFLPAALSRIAYSLLTRKLLPHAPSTLLIEQQRYRSQGSSAVQEWTYRVNMLEGMLWAVLETLRAEEIKIAKGMRHATSCSPSTSTATPSPQLIPLPSPHAVSPQRVANFWMSSTPLGRALMASKQPRRSRSGKQSARLTIDKRDKISFLSAWLARSSGSDAVAIPSVVDAAFGNKEGIAGNDVNVSFATAEAAATRDAFLDKMVGKARGRKKRTATATATATAAGGDAAENVQQQATHRLGTIPDAPEDEEREKERDEALQQGVDHEHEHGGVETAPSPGGRRNQTRSQPQQQSPLLDQRQEDEHEHELAAGHERQTGGSNATTTPSSSSTPSTTSTAASITQERDIGKLDDLADCLLQAAAWARWEGNRRTVHSLANDDGALKQFAAAFADDGATG